MCKGKTYRRILFIMGALGMCVSMAAGVYGYWTASGNTLNVLTMASYRTEILEEYRVPHHVDPGEKVTKVVNVSNTGTVDTLVRVSIKKAFGEKGPEGTFQEDKNLDPEMIEIQFNTSCWKKRRDGYYYYQDILKAGETTREPLLSSYRLSEKAGNEYKGKDAQIVVSMESIQAEGGAQETWGVSLGELGISRPLPQGEHGTRVEYLGHERGFDISEERTDLFASFKNLLPGCSRTQEIAIVNSSGREAKLFLRGAYGSQEKITKEQEKLVRQLLEEYGIIEITGEQGTIYSGPVSGNLKGEGSTLREDIFLGTFENGSRKTLTVKLSLSPEMDNRFLELTGKVKWIFTAREEGEEQISAEVPRTGDETFLGMWIALVVTSAVFMGAAFWLEKRSRSVEEDNDNN